MTYNTYADRKIDSAIVELQKAIESLENMTAYTCNEAGNHAATVHTVNQLITTVLILEKL